MKKENFKKMNIAIVAHDARKKDLLEWAIKNSSKLQPHNIFCTGTTGKVLKKELAGDMNITALKSGPLGGDQEIGVKIANKEIDFLIFMIDGLSIQPHDSDVRALQRLAVIYNVPTANNQATAEICINSPLFANKNFNPQSNNFDNYINRKI